MRVLTYRHLDPGPVQASYDKVVQALTQDDLISPNVKKLAGYPYYRAKLNDTHRLLLTFYRYQGETVCLVLEVILNHQYQKSRFLRGAVVREEQIDVGPVDAPKVSGELRYLHPSNPTFHLLDKPISFDDFQATVYQLTLPLTLIGSAGSGKTALILERLRSLQGRKAYITLSRRLARQAEALYLQGGVQDGEHRAVFLSLSEVLEGLRVPRGQQATFRQFQAWFARNLATCRQYDVNTVYEEICGVITSPPTGPLSAEAYVTLGVRQALYPAEERPGVHALYLKYREWLESSALHAPNLAAFERLPIAAPLYDALVIDEVQDMTSVQLALLIRLLKDPSQLLLCGDANQLLYPNFFSWAATRALFSTAQNPTPGQETGTAQPYGVSVLTVNYRNAREITRVANRLLKIRLTRFGSIDRESNQLAEARTTRDGRVETVSIEPAVLSQLDEAVCRSVDYAVIVLNDEGKAEASQVFQTPLIFTVQEAKGLEYQGVILFNLIGTHRQAYEEIAGDLRPEDLDDDDLRFARASNKRDKSGDRYKFFVNALYVAITRATEEVIMVEQDPGHPLLRLMGLGAAGDQVKVQTQRSSTQTWAAEARRLKARGKTEQAKAIEQRVLKFKSVPWEVLDAEGYRKLQTATFGGSGRDRERRAFLEYNVWHLQLTPLERLQSDYEPARPLARDFKRRVIAYEVLRQHLLTDYLKKNFKSVLWETDRYGLEFRSRLNATPLMLAAAAGNLELVDELLNRGANRDASDQFGQTALMYAMSWALLTNGAASENFPGIYERLAPTFIDVQSEGRLVRLPRDQVEYTVLMRMFCGMKSMLYMTEDHTERIGFTAEDLTFDGLPASAPPALLLDRTRIAGILSRGNIDSGFQSAGRLWVRVEHNLNHDVYLPNPDLLLRVHQQGQQIWKPIREAAGLTHKHLP